MWVFAEFGLLMPSIVSEKDADPKFSEGKYFFQIRGRVTDHLRYFMDNYMEPGSFHDEIHLTPQFDYNCRFYTTKEAFAAGMAKAIADVDYEKFKPASEKRNVDGSYKFGPMAKAYHSVLNSIWSAVTLLAPAGGSWGPLTKDNPNGYDRSWKYSNFSGDRSSTYEGLGSTFGKRAKESRFVDEGGYDYDADEFFKDTPAVLFDEFDYTPKQEEEIELILESLDGIPVAQWFEFTSEREWSLIRDIAEKEMEAVWTREQEESQRQTGRKNRRRDRRNLRKQAARRNKTRKGRKARYQ